MIDIPERSESRPSVRCRELPRGHVPDFSVVAIIAAYQTDVIERSSVTSSARVCRSCLDETALPSLRCR
jgi:hypothetical protein